MIEDIQGYIYELISIQNTTVTLHSTLPPEVLMNVFRHVVPTCRSHIRLTHVCKLWRDLIHLTPEFWADMLSAKSVASWLDYSMSDSPLSLTTFIERSSPVPYALTLRGGPAFLNQIAPHISRISSLYWQLMGHESLLQLQAVLNTDMPQLEVMRCTACVTSPALNNAIQQLSPGKGNFPRLRKLSLLGGFADPVFAFPTLEELKVADILYPQFLILLTALPRGTPQLRTLDLDFGRNWLSLQDVPPSHETVSLPYLRHCYVVIRSREDWYARRILAYVKIPPNANLTIKWLRGYPDSLSRLVPTSPSESLATVHALKSLSIHYYFDSDDGTGTDAPLVLRASGFVRDDTASRLDLTIQDPCWQPADERSPSKALSELAMLFSGAQSLESVAIKLDPDIAVTRDDWLTILDAFRSLMSLNVHIDSCRNLLTVLRRNPSRCPGLRRLSISCKNGSGVHESLLSTIESLARREEPPLEYLAFSGHKSSPLSQHRVQRLQGLVGDVVIGMKEWEL